MKRKELLMNEGGLFRCCVDSGVKWAQDQPEAEVVEGESILCLYEKRQTMVVHNGVLQWNRK